MKDWISMSIDRSVGVEWLSVEDELFGDPAFDDRATWAFASLWSSLACHERFLFCSQDMMGLIEAKLPTGFPERALRRERLI